MSFGKLKNFAIDTQARKPYNLVKVMPMISVRENMTSYGNDFVKTLPYNHINIVF